MKLISVKKETSFKLNAMSDARFYFSWYQMFDVLIFVDTKRSVLGFLVFFFLILLHHKTQFCDDYKEKVIQLLWKNPRNAKGKPNKGVAP